MEKRVIVFLIVSLAVIIGYDYLLKGMGLLPPSEPVQVATNPSPAAETGKPAGGAGEEPRGGQDLRPVRGAHRRRPRLFPHSLSVGSAPERGAGGGSVGFGSQ